MAGTAGNPSSSSSPRGKPAPAKQESGFALLPLGKHLGKPAIPLIRPVIVMGSRNTCRIHLNSSSVSQAHAVLVRSGSTYYIRDLASRTHVLIDDRRVRDHALRDGEVIRIGSFILKFVAPATENSSDEGAGKGAPILPASLAPTSGEMPIPIEERAVLIGRRPGSDVKLLEASASNSHALVFEMDGRHYIRDLGSRTGTFVNRVKIHQHCLSSDDLIRIGETDLHYKASPEAAGSEVIEPIVEPVIAPVPAKEIEHAPPVRAAKLGDDFGLELLPFNQEAAGPVAPVVSDPVISDRMVEPDAPLANTLAEAKEVSGAGAVEMPGSEPPGSETPGQILPGRRSWRAVAPETPAETFDAIAPAPAAQESTETRDEKSAGAEDDLIELAPLAEADDIDLDLPLAPDVTASSDAVGAPGLDLSNFAGPSQSSAHEVDFDESSLVNQDAGPVDVIDFALDWGAPQTQAPLLSAEGIAEIAAAENAQAKREEERRDLEREEAARVAAEKAEAERLEAERIAAETAEQERAEAERVTAEKAAQEQAEAERVAAEKAEAERLEAERIAAEKAEAERLEAERVEAEQAEVARLEAERLEAKRIAAEEAEAERLEAARVAAEKAEQEREEAERVAAEKAEAARLEAERVAAEQAAHARAEAERIEAEKAEAERLEAARVAAEKAEAERLEAERVEAEQAEAARLEAERVAAEKAEAERLEAEFAAAVEKIEAERIASERADAERLISESFSNEETLDITEPTPESAFELGKIEDSVPIDAPSGVDAAVLPYFDAAITASLSDSSFGRAIEDFTGDMSGVLVEPPLEPAGEQPIEPVATQGALPAPPVDSIEPTQIEADLDFFDEMIQPASSDLDLSKLVEPLDEPAAQGSFDAAALADDWEPLPTSDDSSPRPSKADAMAPKPLFPMAETQIGGSFMPWGGNQENFLGGQPVSLRAPANLAPEPASSPKPPEIQQAAARTEPAALPEAPAESAVSQSKEAEDQQIDSVSAMIEDILVGEARPNTSTPTPFSQVSPPPVPRSSQEIGRQIIPEVPGMGATPAVSAPRGPRRPLRRGLAEMVQEQQKAALRVDEQIPPFGTPLPDLAQNRRKSDEPEPLESLAKPPVQETDVFAHTSPGALDEGLGDAEQLIAADPLAPVGREDIATPMDMVFDEGVGSRPLSGRVRGTRFPPSVAPSQAAIGRVNLPNDPFWSGSPGNAAGAGGGGIGGMGGGGGGGGGDGGGDVDLPPIAAMASGQASRGRHAVRPSLAQPKPFRPVKPVRSRMPQFAFAAAEDQSAALAERKRRLRRIPVLMLVGAMLIAADLAGIWKLLPPKSTVDARITYDHLENLSELGRNTFIDQQRALVQDGSTRHRAIEALSKENPETAPGFLDDPVEYAQVAESASWPDQNRNVLVISRTTTNAEGDIPRMKAIGVAIHDGNDRLLDEAKRNQDNLADAQDVIDTDRKSDEDLQKQCDEKRAEAEGRPTPEYMAQLQTDQDRLEKAWKECVVAKNSAEADLQRLQQSSLPWTSGATTMPGTVADTSGGSDAQIQQLQTQLDAINAQMDAAKAARIKQAQQARAELDQTLSEFEKQVADAKALTKDNPELTAYIAAAQKFQDTTRALVDGLIHRQQQQYAQVTEIEASLHEKMEARRQEMWQKDEKLQEMNDQLAYAQRQYNAAISAGEQKEADDRKAEIELRESLIKTREDLIPDDPIYTDAVDQLQKYLDQQQKAMQEDRQTTAKALDDAQQAFADSQPAVDKLPAEQKSLATGMEERLADINAARAKYSDAASAIGDGGDDTSKKLQEQAASIAASIDAHRKQLADASLKNHRGEMEAQRQKEIEEKQAQIATLTKAAADAEAAYTGKENDRQVAEAAMEKARVAGDQLQSLNEQRMGLENQLQQLLGGLKFKQEAVNTSVQPLLITDADIHQRSDPDKRMMYMVSSSVPIGVLFAGLILLTIHGAARELPLNALSPSGEGPEPFSLVSTSNGSEGDSKELDSHDELEGVSNGESNGEPIETLNSLTGAANEADAENPRDAQPAESIQ